MSSTSSRKTDTQDGEILADVFDELLQEILEGRTPDLGQYVTDRPDLSENVAKTWSLACAVAGRREPSQPVLGGYEILRELGHGSMGTVYLARHQILQREVAIKVLPQSLAMSARAKQRFLEEAKSLARIRHENVVSIHRILDHAQMLAFEMEYVDGLSLQDLIKQLRSGPQPPTAEALARQLGVDTEMLGTRNPVEWFVRTCSKVARALDVVHRHGLIHRDVKPSNILLRTGGDPVLADFGLARDDNLDGAHKAAFAGTPVYAAPERLRNSRLTATASSDVYSLGATLYELLALTPPFSGRSRLEVLRRIETGGLVSLRKKAPHIPSDLAIVVHKAMEPDPRHRYATAEEFADDLDRLLNLEPVHARPVSALRRAAKFVRRNRRPAFAALAGALLFATASGPIIAHTLSRQADRDRAARQLHAARGQLLSPEALHASWTHSATDSSNQPLQDLDAMKTNIEALEACVTAYERALDFDNDDAETQLELDVVRSALRVQRSRKGSHFDIDGIPTYLARIAHHKLHGDGHTNITLSSSAPLDIRFAVGLLMFLIGEPASSSRIWQSLSDAQYSQPLFEACRALQLANDGYAELAYPRLFHSLQTFPEATVLGLTMAETALVMGNTQLAKEWLEQTRADNTARGTHPRHRLLEADLLAAIGNIEDSASIYRELRERDVSDPVPVQRLASLAISKGNRVQARRLLRDMLRRWPEHATARRQLAWLALQERNLAAYLMQVRFVLAQNLDVWPRSSARTLNEILWLGGLERRTDNTDDSADHRQSPYRARLPLSHWLSASTCESIAQTMDVLAQFDRAHNVALALDTRPIGVALRTAWLSALSLPQITMAAHWAIRTAVLAGIPNMLGVLTHYATHRLMPLQRILGDDAMMVVPKVLVPFHTEPVRLNFAYRTLRGGDIDGDTLEDICIVHTTAPEHEALARIEVRALADGSLLQTLTSDRDHHRFGHGFAVLEDADGDHCQDLLIGSPATERADGNGVVELRSGRTGAVLWSTTGSTRFFGESVATIDDVNGDTIRDILISAPATKSLERGRLFLGSGSDGRLLREIDAGQTNQWFGRLIVAIGDTDADGSNDVLVTGTGMNSAGFAVVLSGRTQEVLATFAEKSATADFGFAATDLGDVDGDGHDDFAISSPGYSGRAQRAGHVDLLSGKTGKLLRVIRGNRPGEGFGTALCGLPSWRGDGRKALAISAFRGGPSGSGYVRIYDAITGNPLQTLAANPNVRLLGVSLCDLGDRDGDGLRDLAVPMMYRDGRCMLSAMSFALVEPRRQ